MALPSKGAARQARQKAAAAGWGIARPSRAARRQAIQRKATPARSRREAAASRAAVRSTRVQETQSSTPSQGSRPRPASSQGSHQRAGSGRSHNCPPRPER